MHGHEATKLRFDLREHTRRAARYDRDARQVLLVLSLRYGQALDVVASTREQTDDPRENARLVIHHHSQGRAMLGLVVVGDEVSGSRWGHGRVQTSALPFASIAFATASSVASSGSSISLCALPLGIMGKQLARFATRQSIRTGPG